MAIYKVRQRVLCEVSVWYEVECDTMENALGKVAFNTSPTSMSLLDGNDYEITSDEKILSTTIEEVEP